MNVQFQIFIVCGIIASLYIVSGAQTVQIDKCDSNGHINLHEGQPTNLTCYQLGTASNITWYLWDSQSTVTCTNVPQCTTKAGQDVSNAWRNGSQSGITVVGQRSHDGSSIRCQDLQQNVQLICTVKIVTNTTSGQGTTTQTDPSTSGLETTTPESTTTSQKTTTQQTDTVTSHQGTTNGGGSSQGTTGGGSSSQGTTESGSSNQGTTGSGGSSQGTTGSGSSNQDTTESGSSSQGTTGSGNTATTEHRVAGPSDDDDVPLGAIIGGVLGGFALLIIIIVIIVIVVKRRQRRENEHDGKLHPRRVFNEDDEFEEHVNPIYGTDDPEDGLPEPKSNPYVNVNGHNEPVALSTFAAPPASSADNPAIKADADQYATVDEAQPDPSPSSPDESLDAYTAIQFSDTQNPASASSQSLQKDDNGYSSDGMDASEQTPPDVYAVVDKSKQRKASTSSARDSEVPSDVMVSEGGDTYAVVNKRSSRKPADAETHPENGELSFPDGAVYAQVNKGSRKDNPASPEPPSVEDGDDNTKL